MLFAIFLCYSDNKSFNVHSPTFLAHLGNKVQLDKISAPRYVGERHIRKSLSQVFEENLCVNKDGIHWLNDTEFKNKYRMDRDTLDEVTKRIEDHPIFKRDKRGQAQRPMKH